MTSIFADQHSDTRIFVFSAMGSLVVHGLLVAGLASLPKTTIVKDDPPTVQVTLLPSPEVIQAPQTSQAEPTPTLPLQPHIAILKAAPPPMPLARLNRLQPPPLLQASRPASLSRKPSPLTSPTPTKPILQDTRASQAMKARAMMKMRVPRQTKLTSLSLPTGTTRIHAESRTLPPISPMKKERSTTQSLPAPPSLATPRTLIATPPTHTGSMMTRPAIISSSRPVYPRVARESGWEGTVIVRTRIDTNGMPNQVNIHKSCGYPTLDQAAQDAVKRWAFRPAKDGNIPITKWVDIPIKFDLTS